MEDWAEVLERGSGVWLMLDGGEAGIDPHAFLADLPGSASEALGRKISTGFTTRLVLVLTAEILGERAFALEESCSCSNWIWRNWFTFGAHCVPFLTQHVPNLQVAVNFLDATQVGARL